MEIGGTGPFVVNWVPGSKHKAADALSRNPAHQTTADDECGEDADAPAPQNVLVAELQASHTDLLLDRVGVNAEEHDFKMFKDAIFAGFPTLKTGLAEPLRKYWPVYDRLSMDGGLIICGIGAVVQKLPEPIDSDDHSRGPLK